MSKKLDKEEKRLYNQNLIEFVHSHPILFNTRSDEYKNNVKKNILWNKFGADQFPAETDETVKTKWNVLRTCYSRAKKEIAKKKVSGSGASTKAAKPWEYYESMKFLDDYMEPCENVLSVPIPKDTEKELDVTRKDHEEDAQGQSTTDQIFNLTLMDDHSNTFSPDLVGDSPNPFIRPHSFSSFLSEYSSSPSPQNFQQSSQTKKRSITSWSNDQEPSQKKKRSKESNPGNSFLEDVSLLLAKESASEASQSDKLLQQFLEMQNNEVALFLKSLQPSLERFLSNRLVYS